TSTNWPRPIMFSNGSYVLKVNIRLLVLTRKCSLFPKKFCEE
ncbi:gene model 1553, (NCBI), partial [Mus musculus]